MPPSNLPRPALLPIVLLLLVLLLSLTGCGHNSPRSESSLPVLPASPSLTTPLPSVPYSTSAKLNIEAWQKSLTATPLTPKP